MDPAIPDLDDLRDIAKRGGAEPGRHRIIIKKAGDGHEIHEMMGEECEGDCIEKIIIKEKPDAILPTLGGQTALNTALNLADMATRFLGKSTPRIDCPQGWPFGVC